MLVPIVLDLPIRTNLVIRDRFDWDLSDPYKNPYLFSQRLAEELNLNKKQRKNIAKTIIDQIIEHIIRFTVQTRTRIPKRFEEHHNLTCMQCDSILYTNDICRACGVSLEKLRAKYGHLINTIDEPEEEQAVRQTERQRTLDRRRGDVVQGRKSCPRCGENNHLLSMECRQCGKHFPKMKKPKGRSEALAF